MDKNKAGLKTDILKGKPAQSKRCLFKPSRWISEGQFEAAVLVNLNTGIYYAINQTVEKIWLAINGKRTVQGIAAKAARSFSVRKEKILPDVVKTLHMFGKAGVVRWKRVRS